MSSSNTIQSIDRALSILEFLYRHGHEASISEISAATNLFGSTIHRILRTLKERGYVYQNQKTSKYWLGMRFYALGNAVKENMPLVSIIEPLADIVARKYGETVYVAVPSFLSPRQAQQALILKISYSTFILRTSPNVGAVTLAHGSATGKCMMAYYSEALLETYRQYPLVQQTEKTITDWDVMLKELRKIRQNGYAIDREEEETGLTCVAVPIIDSRGSIIAAISLSGPTHRMSEFAVEDILADLKHVSSQINTYI